MPGLAPGMFFFAPPLAADFERRDIAEVKRLIKSRSVWHCEFAGSRRRSATSWSLSSPNG
jgi:hypothetical protein